ncbi:MAG: glycerate kinase [Thermoleophilia bacterium]|nr:glycerate kinase [Thermoleophilia bacterium]
MPSALCCPDSLKGVLSAVEAAAALADGFRGAGVEAAELPLADGGEGTAQAIALACGGEWRTARVADPLGRPVDARFLVDEEGRAVVEAAEAIGLGRLAAEERDPLRASSRGLGDLVLAAVEAGAERVTVGLGGTATVDGGAGLLDVLDALPVPVTAACDVGNPLLGPRGAARVFGPQKGATAAEVDELEARLAARRDLAPFAGLPGAGAAGGLGAAFASLGAELRPGFQVVAETLDLEAALAKAATAVTGEGAVDRSTADGKVPAGVAAAAVRAGVRCVVFGGRVEPGAPAALYELGATAVLRLSGDPAEARSDLVELGEALGRLLFR